MYVRTAWGVHHQNLPGKAVLMEEKRQVARRGDHIMGKAEKELEQENGQPVETAQNTQIFQR